MRCVSCVMVLTLFAANLPSISAQDPPSEIHPGQAVIEKFLSLVAAEKYDDANQLVDLNPQIRPDVWNSNLQGIHKLNQASPLKMQEYWAMGETVVAATPPVELPTRPGVPAGPKKVLQVTAKSMDGTWTVYGIVTSSPEYWQKTVDRIKREDGKQLLQPESDK